MEELLLRKKHLQKWKSTNWNYSEHLKGIFLLKIWFSFVDVASMGRKIGRFMGTLITAYEMKPWQSSWSPFRRSRCPENTAGVSFHILETNRKQQRWQKTRGGKERRKPRSEQLDSSENWGCTRDAVSVSEGLSSSVLLPQEANACRPAARQHRHQPHLQVRDPVCLQYYYYYLSIIILLMWRSAGGGLHVVVTRFKSSTVQREAYPGWSMMKPRHAGRLRAEASGRAN